MSLLLLDLPREILIYHIFSFFNAHSVAPLRIVCKTLQELVDGVRRFRLHFMEVDGPWDVPLRILNYAWIDERICEEVLEQLHEYGYVGEGRVMATDPRVVPRFVLLNDFYARGFKVDHWDTFIENLRNDQEFDFHWIFYEWPTLPGRERYFINQVDTVHRGSCVWVSFSIPTHGKKLKMKS